MCTVPSSDRRRCFLQYNFMDPGWGARISYGRGQAPCPLPPLAPALWRVNWLYVTVVFPSNNDVVIHGQFAGLGDIVPLIVASRQRQKPRCVAMLLNENHTHSCSRSSIIHASVVPATARPYHQCMPTLARVYLSTEFETEVNNELSRRNRATLGIRSSVQRKTTVFTFTNKKFLYVTLYQTSFLFSHLDLEWPWSRRWPLKIVVREWFGC